MVSFSNLLAAMSGLRRYFCPIMKTFKTEDQSLTAEDAEAQRKIAEKLRQ